MPDAPPLLEKGPPKTMSNVCASKKHSRILRSGEAAYFVPDAVPLDQRPFATATGYRGVVRKRGKFQAQIGSRKHGSTGTYATAEEALCFDREAIRRFGNRAAINFGFPSLTPDINFMCNYWGHPQAQV